ncbi:MAG: efflux RND transporter periplasmic adaptor subunit [Deltaproteobacteria bacterium]|nr:efflux RND transporter periplasmic adaptor subunit [Deltaproteobacteria bacterium]
MNSLTRSVLNLVVIGSILAICGLASAGEQESTVPVTTVVVRKHAIKQTLALTGSVEAFRRVTVYSKVTGVIEKLLVERGMKVKKGDVIAVVEHETELAQRKELLAAVEAAKVGVRQAEAADGVAQAALQQAEAQLENAVLEKTRAQNLYADNSIPKQKYDAIMAQYKIALAGRDLAAAKVKAAQAALAQAKVGLKQAEAALYRLDTRIADYTIRAPIAGVVTARFVDEGAMDSPSLPIVEIMDTSILKVNCDVAQVDAAKVKEGQEVKIITDAYPGVEFEGKVAIVNPSLDSKTRTLPVEIRTTGKPVAGKGEGAVSPKPGMFVKLTIAIGEKTALAVPRDCLMRLPGTGVYYLFVVKDGKAEKRTVEVGVGRDNLVEIISGVTEGDRVVIRGQANLKSGTPVIEAK